MYVSALSNRVQLSVYDDHFLFSALSDSSALTSCHVVVKKKKIAHVNWQAVFISDKQGYE